MVEITEQDIVNHLKSKIKFHEMEIKKIEQVLSTLSATPGSLNNDAKKNAKGNSAGNNKQPGVAEKPHKELVVPSKFSPDLTSVAKITYVLNEIGDGFKEDIANKIAALEPGIDPIKLGRDISGILSTLKNKGLVATIKIGRKHRYSLLAIHS
ncbi:hypothetical protein [Mucilaginibacter sp.]|uniref:hypothetical protein n=1 Tax=Mucilaginibacter sp. TaxID=1882438 RepID=UPI0025EE196E|nr:hypothetical protein [Mucilaginibacter sp.]